MRPGFNPWVGKIPWRRAWQPTPVFLPAESHGQRSLMDYSPWDRKEPDTTEWLSTALHSNNHSKLTTVTDNLKCQWLNPIALIPVLGTVPCRVGDYGSGGWGRGLCSCPLWSLWSGWRLLSLLPAVTELIMLLCRRVCPYQAPSILFVQGKLPFLVHQRSLKQLCPLPEIRKNLLMLPAPFSAEGAWWAWRGVAGGGQLYWFFSSWA